MRLFGSLSELVSLVYRKNSQAITLRPNQTTTYTASRDIQTPQQDADSVLISRNSTDTVLNKTLDNTNVITVKDTNFTLQDDGDVTKQAMFQLSGITTGNTRTFTLPDSSGTLITSATATFSDTQFTLQDDGDATKQAQFQLSGITTGTTRTYTLPNASSTLVDLSTSQTLTNKDLTATSNTYREANGSTNNGAVSTGTQSFAGVKTFTGQTIVNASVPTDFAAEVINTSGANSTDNGLFVKVNTSGATKALAINVSGTDVVTVNGVGLMTFSTGGLSLPTSGGTPTTLSYYEETTSGAVTFTANVSAATASVTVQITRIGRLVHLRFPSFTVTTTSSDTAISSSGGAIASRFRPGASTFIAGHRVTTGGTAQTNTGSIRVQSGGTVDVYRDSSTSTAYGASTTFDAFDVTYSI